MANCLNWESKEVELLANQVAVENTPAFADKIGTLMDSLNIENIEQLPSSQQVKDYLKSTEENLAKLRLLRAGGNPLSGLKHAEVMLPAWSKELFKGFIDEDGNLDFDKINKELPEILEMIGYRIPTEDKYSILPLKVVGFMPFQSGGSVVLPSEITTISGSDFDIDKLYIMMKKFIKKGGKYQVEKYLDESNSTVEERKLAYAKKTKAGMNIISEYKEKITEINDRIKSLKNFYNIKSEISEQLNILADEIRDVKESIIPGVEIYTMVDGRMMSNSEHIKYLEDKENELYEQLSNSKNLVSNDGAIDNIKELRNKEKAIIEEMNSKILKTISDEDFNELSIPDQNTKGARDNRKLDIMTSVLQHESTTEDIMKPGGFVRLTEIASTIDELKGFKNKIRSLFDEMSLDAITIQLTTGKPLVGIAANHNSHAHLRQHYNLKLKKDIKFDGKNLNNLSAKESLDGKVTANLSEISAAIVDNGKDPLADKLNYNEYTADLVSLLIGVGVPLKTSFAFINHPSILAAVKKINQGDASSLQDGLKLVMIESGIKYDKKNNIRNINTSDLLSAIGKPLSENIVLNNAVLINAMEYLSMSKSLGDLIMASKADTSGITQSIEGGQHILDLIKKILTNENFPIDGAVEFLEGVVNEDKLDDIQTEGDENSITWEQFNSDTSNKQINISYDIGSYVKYNNEIYIITQINKNDTIQIYNPTKEGVQAKKSVAKINVELLQNKAKIVTDEDNAKYIVTPKDTIISLRTNKIMNWDENNGNRKRILKLKDNTFNYKDSENTSQGKLINNIVELAKEKGILNIIPSKEELQSYMSVSDLETLSKQIENNCF